jgi:hypothetical protein
MIEHPINRAGNILIPPMPPQEVGFVDIDPVIEKAFQVKPLNIRGKQPQNPTL